MRLLTAILLAGSAGLGTLVVQGGSQSAMWQADLAIRSLEVSEGKGNLTARVVVTADFGEALATRVEVFLPVGVGIVSLGTGCAAGPDRTGISALRARVECSLGNLPPRSHRELLVVTTIPPVGMARGFAVLVISDTPDPKPANNFAERVIPRDDPIERRL